MIKYRITCPDCSASVYAIYPEAVLWERCPACLRHVWDTYDLKLADVVRGHDDPSRKQRESGSSPIN